MLRLLSPVVLNAYKVVDLCRLCGFTNGNQLIHHAQSKPGLTRQTENSTVGGSKYYVLEVK